MNVSGRLIYKPYLISLQIREFAKEVHNIVSIAFPEATKMWEIAHKIDQELAEQKAELWETLGKIK